MSEATTIPPQAVELEETILGAILMQKDAILEVIEILHPDCFYKDSHQIIYKNMIQLFDTGQPIDILTLTEALKRRKVFEKIGDSVYLNELISRVGSTANLEHHARIIQQKYVAREYINTFVEASKKLYDPSEDLGDVLDGVERTTMDIHYMMNKKREKNMNQVIKKTMDAIEKASNQSGSITGVSSGHSDIDRLTGGWQDTDLIFIAARPGMGKTTFILHSALLAARDYKTPIGIFSLEMSVTQLGQKMISMATGINTQNMRLGKVGKDEWVMINTKGGNLGNLPIVIEDSAALDILDIKSKARSWAKKYGVKMIVIDYLQLIRTRGRHNNKNEMIEYISSQLKAIAKELEIPIVCLSQLSRETEKRSNKRPQLSDLRDSGAIEQDADIVVFLYSPDYYDPDAVDESGISLKGVSEVNFAKHRNGALSTFYKRFRKETSEFLPMEDDEPVKQVGLPYKDDEKELKIAAKPTEKQIDDSPF